MIKKWHFGLMLSLFSGPILADSFFKAVSFPQTAGDLSFATRTAIQAAGFEPYSGLNAYEYFNLVETESDMQDEIEQDEEQDITTINTTQNPGGYVPYTPYQDSNNAGTSQYYPHGQGGTQIIPNTYNSGTGYCQNKSSNIPAGQTIPLGNPTNIGIARGVCSKFGWRKMGKTDDPHYGIDLGCNGNWLGTPVYAIADGKVIRTKAAGNNESAGNYIKIQHSSGFVSYYMHLDKIMVSNGQMVQAGCQIGTIGHTGGAKASKVRSLSVNQSHLHYQLGYSGNQQSITASNGKKLELRGLNGKALSYSIDPTEFLCYDGTPNGACNW